MKRNPEIVSERGLADAVCERLLRPAGYSLVTDHTAKRRYPDGYCVKIPSRGMGYRGCWVWRNPHEFLFGDGSGRYPSCCWPLLLDKRLWDGGLPPYSSWQEIALDLSAKGIL